MADTEIVQSGETPEDAQVTPPRLTSAQRLERLENRVIEMHAMVKEIHKLSKDAWDMTMGNPLMRAQLAARRTFGGRSRG